MFLPTYPLGPQHLPLNIPRMGPCLPSLWRYSASPCIQEMLKVAGQAAVGRAGWLPLLSSTWSLSCECGRLRERVKPRAKSGPGSAGTPGSLTADGGGGM